MQKNYSYTQNGVTVIFFTEKENTKYSFKIENDQEMTGKILRLVKDKLVSEKHIFIVKKIIFSLIEELKRESSIQKIPLEDFLEIFTGAFQREYKGNPNWMKGNLEDDKYCIYLVLARKSSFQTIDQVFNEHFGNTESNTFRENENYFKGLGVNEKMAKIDAAKKYMTAKDFEFDS